MAISFNIQSPPSITFNTTTQSNIGFSIDRISSSSTYIHTQSVASSAWEITHNLNKFPSVTIVDSGENVVIGDVQYISNKVVKCYFTSAFSGKAYLN